MLQNNNILITGGTGRLGKACRKIFPNALYPSSSDMDIKNIEHVEKYISKHKPGFIIHLAAIAGIPDCENNKPLAWETNVEGTKNILKIGKKYGVRKFLYLQTACVFSGENAPYDEDSIMDPKHYYGFTKAIAEEVVTSYDSSSFNTLIARTNFTTMPWEYENAFTDRYGTYLFAQGVAKGLKDFLENNKGKKLIHICGDKKISMYEYAKLGGSNVGQMTLSDYSGTNLTRDMSLTTKNWHTYKIKESDFNDN